VHFSKNQAERPLIKEAASMERWGLRTMSDGKSPFWFYPKRTGDPGRDRNAQTLQFTCLLFAIAIGIAVAWDVISREPIPIPLVSGALGGLCAAAVLNHAGSPTWAGRIVILALLLCAVLRVVHASDGFRSHAMLMFPGVLLLSVMLLDRSSYVTTAGIVMLTVAALGIAEKHGLFGAIPPVRTPTNYESIFLIELTLVAFSLVGSRIARDAQSNVSDLYVSISQLSTVNFELRKTAEALRQNEQQLASIYNTVGDVIFQLAVESEGQFRFISVNAAFLRVTGLSREAVVGKAVNEVIPEPSLTMVLRKYQQAIEENTIVSWEETSDYPTGRLTGEVSVVPVFDHQGTCTHLVGSVHDITERKRAEASLRESEERFRKMADTAPVMIWITGPDKLFTFVNKTWLDFTGRTMEQELGNGWAAGVHPDDLQRSYEVFGAAFEARRNFQLECRLRRWDGEYRLILCSGIPRFASGGVFAGYIGSDVDITDLQSEERFRQLAENIDQVFWMFDLGTQRLLYVSPAFEKVWGYSSTALYQNPDWLVQSVHAEDRDGLMALLSKARSEAVEASYRIVQPGGSVKWIQGRSFPIRDGGGRPYRVAGIAEDVTGHREMEEQLRQAQKMEAVGRLAGGIAHDFNNLLTVINGYTDLLLRKSSANDQTYTELNEIRSAGQRAHELTSQMLAFSRNQIRSTEVLSLQSVIEDVAKMLRPMIGEDIELVIALDPESGQVKADRTELTQILLNLAANARDAMPTGGILTFETRSMEVDDSLARSHPGSQPGPYVRLTVIDTGVGMDAKTQQHLFEPFFTTKQVGKGTGLGLATVYGIVSHCGGWIDVKSKPEGGATFQIYLPRLEVSAFEGSEFPEPARVQLRGTETVLVVEDQPHVRKLTCAILKEFGYQTLEASHGEEALRLAATHKGSLDLVLTDVIMSGMHGPELANRLKVIRPSPILFMSGYSGSMEGGHDPKVGYIGKPFTPDTLARKVREVLDATGLTGTKPVG
jgi:PAS domain S-box-containing protein